MDNYNIINKLMDILKDNHVIISRVIAIECWKQYSYACGDTINYVDLPKDPKVVVAIVKNRLNKVKSGFIAYERRP